MPEADFYKADTAISWMVRKFEAIRSEYSALSHTDNFIPRPDVALVFNFKGIPEVLSPESIRLKPLFIATIPVKPLQLSLNKEVDSFIVICHATVLSRVLGISLRNDIVPLVEITDKGLLQLWEQLSFLSSDNDRIQCFSKYIADLLPAGYRPDDVDEIYMDILRNSLRKSLDQITEKACSSLSSLQRRFLVRSGLSMKKMIRIARVHAIFNKMLGEAQFNCANILFDSNYYDQAHFIRDFKDITGMTPRQFFTQNSALLRMMSGMESLV